MGKKSPMKKAMQGAAAPKKRARTPASCKTLLSKLVIEDKVEPPPKKRTRTEAEAFDKMLLDNFYNHGFSKEEVPAACRDGVWLLDLLAKGRETWKKGDLVMGGPYYAEKRARLRDPNSPFVLLKVANEDGAVPTPPG